MIYNWTRRQLLTRAGTGAAAAAAAGAAGWKLSRRRTDSAGTERYDSKDVQHFVSRPDLHPPKVTLLHVEAGHELKYLFLGLAASGPGQGGSMITDTMGDMIWFSPDAAGKSKMDFDCQIYQGKPVLTWFQGRVVSGGHGEGIGLIADSSYRQIATVRAHDGLEVDLHEFVITAKGTALVSAFRTLRHDFSAMGGPKDGWLLSGVAQEIDIATGELLFSWDSLDHVGLDESCLPFNGGHRSRPYDYFHINTIAEYDDEHLLIGARNTWCVYKVRRTDGQIVWRLNGKKSDFTMAPGSRFYWQHDTRPHGPNLMTVFDDGFDGKEKDEKESRALILDVDTDAMLVTLKRQFTHPGALVLAKAMGNVQLLPGGGVFVGWGTNLFFSEFSADGKLLLDGILAKGAPTYRSFIGDWDGHPTELPAVAVRRRNRGVAVYASWNGATAVASWTVLAGKTAASMTPVGSAPRAGFETTIEVTGSGPYFAAQPHDAAGRILSRSSTVRLT
ncbi:MAG TPA: arylsulfotransferase family protein [Streptosporangiaceae bacterium]